MKFSVNNFCPCGSGNKYKKCCQVFHKGKIPKTALELMKSRYVAYKIQNSKYIISTTYQDNIDYSENYLVWEKQILDFSKNCDFNNLEILEFIEADLESYVTFRVQLICNDEDNSFSEKSKFIKKDGKWFYHSGEFDG